MTRVPSWPIIARRTSEPAPSAAISGASRSRCVLARDFVEHDELVVLEIERARGLQEAGLDAVAACAHDRAARALRPGRETE